MLTERRKGDRIKMAAAIETLSAEFGADVKRSERDREIRLDICSGDATVGIEFDGDTSNPDVFCMPWCVDYRSEARFSALFGRAVGGGVNEAHGRKAMAFARGFDCLVDRLRLALQCIADGQAFIAPGEPIPFTGASHDPATLKNAGFRPIGDRAAQISAGCYQRAATEHGIAQAELTGFRMPDGYWQMYRKPETVEAVA